MRWCSVRLSNLRLSALVPLTALLLAGCGQSLPVNEPTGPSASGNGAVGLPATGDQFSCPLEAVEITNLAGKKFSLARQDRQSCAFDEVLSNKPGSPPRSTLPPRIFISRDIGLGSLAKLQGESPCQFVPIEGLGSGAMTGPCTRPGDPIVSWIVMFADRRDGSVWTVLLTDGSNHSESGTNYLHYTAAKVASVINSGLK